jgi:hypothetical protein
MCNSLDGSQISRRKAGEIMASLNTIWRGLLLFECEPAHTSRQQGDASSAACAAPRLSQGDIPLGAFEIEHPSKRTARREKADVGHSGEREAPSRDLCQDRSHRG